MQLKDFAAAWLRRWYLVLVGVVCAVVATAFVVVSVGPRYDAKATVLMMPPSNSGQDSRTTGNPFLMLGSLTQARDVLIRALTSKEMIDKLCEPRPDVSYEAMRTQLCKSHAGVTFEVTPDFTSSAPMVLVTVEADSATNSIIALHAITDRVPEVLTDLQSGLGLRAKAEITSMPVVVDSKPDVMHKQQIRAGIVAAAGTLGLSLLLIGLLDGLVMARKGRRAAESDQGLAPVASPPPSDLAPRRGRRASEANDVLAPVDSYPTWPAEGSESTTIASGSGPTRRQGRATAKRGERLESLSREGSRR